MPGRRFPFTPTILALFAVGAFLGGLAYRMRGHTDKSQVRRLLHKEDEMRQMFTSPVTRGGSRVALQIILPEVATVGEPVVAEIVLKNVGTKLVQFMDHPRIIDLHVFDARSRRVARTEAARGVLPPEDGGLEVSGDSRALPPGESHRWERDLGTLFKLRPGNYVAEASVDVEVINSGKREYAHVLNRTEFEIVRP